MSTERARAALHGRPTDRIPLFEMPSHPGFLRRLTGLDPQQRPVEAIQAAIRKLDVDLMLGSVPRGMMQSYSEAGWRNRESTRSDIWGYDPSRDRTDVAGMSEDEAFRVCQGEIDLDTREGLGVALPIGRTFTTCIHYAAEDLNWEEFLMACVAEEDRVAALLDRFEACSAKILRAWMRTSAEFMLTHDDIAMNIGTVQSPDWLRRHLVPRYRRLFEVVRARGLPHVFMTDGDFIAVAKDIAEAGAGGFFLDAPCVDLEWLVGQCGRDLIYFTGPAPALMSVGSPGAVRAEVKRLCDIARRDLPRFFLFNWYTPEMPTENVQAYYDACRDYGAR